MNVSPSIAPAMTRRCFGLPTLPISGPAVRTASALAREEAFRMVLTCEPCLDRPGALSRQGHRERRSRTLSMTTGWARVRRARAIELDTDLIDEDVLRGR